MILNMQFDHSVKKQPNTAPLWKDTLPLAALGDACRDGVHAVTSLRQTPGS
jgi:hypothetical protein